jgi:hypothetical protein
MNSRGRRVERRAAERRARKQKRSETTQMIVPEHLKVLVKLISGR